MNNLAIYGAGGHGKVVGDLAKCVGWKKINFYAEHQPDSSYNNFFPYLGDFNSLLNNLKKYDGVIVAIGNNEARWKIFQKLKIVNAPIATLVHPKAIIGSHVNIGDGTVIVAGSVINIGVRIGEACIINTGSTIDHDSFIGNAVQVCPGANLAGSVSVGNSSWIGIGAIVIQGIYIGSNVTIGAGTVVIENVLDGLKVVGNPARVIKT